MVDYVVGIDLGTQGCSTILVGLSGDVLGKGDYPIPMLEGPDGEREQKPDDWKQALAQSTQTALAQAREKCELDNCLGVQPSGQMHGLGMLFKIVWEERWISQVPLWCDARNSAEAAELTALFGINVPQRLTVSRWLWAIRNRHGFAKDCIYITTPAGVIASYLDAKLKGLGLGDAQGMFPIDPTTLAYDRAMAEAFDQLTHDMGVKPILELLAPPVSVGTIVGYVSPEGEQLTGLPQGTPIFGPEGDQPTTLAGTFVAESGVMAMSGGTSICANLITNTPFHGIHPGVEPFMAADGQPFLMCHVQHGTSYMNTAVSMFGELLGGREPFATLMPLAEEADVDCGGITVLPWAGPEHGLGFPDFAVPGIFGLHSGNAKPGNVVQACLVGAMFSILHSVEAMRKQNILASEIVASGGIVRSPWIGQLIADIFRTPVSILGEAEEGSAYGAALMALFGHRKQTETDLAWPSFLNEMRPPPTQHFTPIPENVGAYHEMYGRFSQLAERVEPLLIDIFGH